MDDDLVLRAGQVALGAHRAKNSRLTLLHRNIAGATAGQLSLTGSATIDAANSWLFKRAGHYALEGKVTASRYAGASGLPTDGGFWSFTALFYSDGTAAGTQCLSVNGNPANVGAEIAPTESYGDGSTYRLIVAADTTFGAPSISGKGASSHTVAWAAHLNRIASGNA